MINKRLVVVISWVILVIVSMSYAATASRTVYVNPGDNLRNVYVNLKNAGLVLSSTDRARIVMKPGTYADTLTLDAEYIDLVEEIPGTVDYTGVITVTAANAKAIPNAGQITSSISQSNTKVVGLTDNRQEAYSWLKSSNRNGQMGALSETNRRQLVLSPGEYVMTETVLLDTDYVDVVELIPGSVTIVKPGNGLGFALLPGVKAKLFTQDDGRYKGNFSRPSMTYSQFDSYSIHEPTYKSIGISGFATNAVETATDIGGSAACSIQYAAASHLYGVSSNTAYKSVDGSTWTSAGALPAAPLHLWAVGTSGNCVLCTSAFAIYYGTADGDGNLTFTRARLAGADFSGGSSSMEFWNFKELSSGTLLLSQYAISATADGRYIYRSIDGGKNWSICYDPGSGIITHWHGFGELLSTHRIIATSGDGIKSKSIVSDDDGLTWTDLYPLGTKGIQPINYLDVGHPTKLFALDDTSGGIFLFDLYTAEITMIFNDQDRRTNTRGYFFTGLVNDGTVYACGLDLTTNAVGATPAIYASNDLVNWSVIYRINTLPAQGAYRAMWFGDKLHARVAAIGATPVVHLSLTPPAIGSGHGVRVEQAVTNQLNTSDTSSFEGTDAITHVYAYAGTATRVTAATAGVLSIPHGSKAVKMTRTTNYAMDSLLARSSAGTLNGIPVATGSKYSGSFWLGVPTDGVMLYAYAYWCKKSGTLGTASLYATNSQTTMNYPIVTSIRPGEWKLMQMPPILVDAADEEILGIFMRTQAADSSITTTSYLVDQVQITEAGGQPTNWQLGGTPRASAKYDLSWQTQDKATHIFTFAPFEKAECYNTLGGDWYIRSWRVSATVYAQLYYDADDQKYKLYATDGTNNDTLATDARYFKKGQPILFAVQFGDDGDTNLHLHVGDGGLVSGGTIKTVDGAAEDYSAFNLASMTVRWGDKDAANGLNGTIYDLDMTGQLAASQIVSYVDGLLDD